MNCLECYKNKCELPSLSVHVISLIILVFSHIFCLFVTVCVCVLYMEFVSFLSWTHLCCGQSLFLSSVDFVHVSFFLMHMDCVSRCVCVCVVGSVSEDGGVDAAGCLTRDQICFITTHIKPV